MALTIKKIRPEKIWISWTGATMAAVLSAVVYSGTALAQPPEPVQDRIVALLEWSEDNERFEYRLELFPIVYYHEAGYGEAQPIDCSVLPGDSAVKVGQVFGVYSRGERVGTFSVSGLRDSRRSCCPVQVGTGQLVLEGAEGRFLPVKEPLLAVFPPLGFASPAERLWSQVDQDPERFTQTVLPLMRDRMDAYIEQEGWDSLQKGPVEIHRRVPYVLDGGGTIAVLTEAGMSLSPRGETAGRHGRRVGVRLIMWLKLGPDGSPVEMMRFFHLQPGFDPAGRDASRFRLIDILDVDSDGRSELLYRVDGYRNHSFRLYSPGAEAPLVFDGARFGCDE